MTLTVVRTAFVELAGSDALLVERLVRGCSPASLRRRFFLPRDLDTDLLLGTYLPYLLAGPPAGVALAAVVDGEPAGLLNLAAAGDRHLELGILVADRWQRRGIATALLGHATTPGRHPGRTVRAGVQPDNAAALALLRTQPGAHLIATHRGEYHFEWPLP
jgi:GNAT superfamily N-acetyltransferase